MFARIHDKARNQYYKSIVYCCINPGYNGQYVAVNPETQCFELADSLDKSGAVPEPLVEIIQDDTDGWVHYENAHLLRYKAHCQENGKEMTIHALTGYRDVCDNSAFLCAILERRAIPVAEAGVALREPDDAAQWNYIRTQADADAFMKLFAAFHDSTLEKLCYEETYGTTKATAIFNNSGWYGIAELCFEGVLALNLRPPKENYSREILDATLLVRDETVLWTDSAFWPDGQDMQQEMPSSDCSYIKALNLKWRKIG